MQPERDKDKLSGAARATAAAGHEDEAAKGGDPGAALTRSELEASDLLEMAKDKFKSRLLQRSLLRGGPEVAELIFNKAERHFPELVRHQNGNYLSQKILELATPEQFDALFAQLAPQLRDLARDAHGTRTVQKVVEQAISRGKVAELLEALPGDCAEELARSVTGFHVVVKLLEALPAKEAEDLLERLCGTAEKALRLGMDQWGCCVLKRCLDRAEGSTRQRIADAVVRNTTPLMEDAFGNYVVQHLILAGNARPGSGSIYVTKVVDALRGRIFELSLQKFSSNVLEKCLSSANESDRTRIVNEILNPPNGLPASEAVRQLLFHQYGNYVLQSALEVTGDPQFSLLVAHLQPHVAEILRSAERDPAADGGGEQGTLAPEHSKRLALKLVKKYPSLGEGLEAGWGQCFDPAGLAADYGFDGLAASAWPAAALGALPYGYPGVPGWDPAFAAALSERAGLPPPWLLPGAAAAPAALPYAYPPAAQAGRGGKGRRHRSRGPKGDGERGGADPGGGAKAANAGAAAADTMKVGRIVGFWPHYQITYDDVPAPAGGGGRGRSRRQPKSKASPKRAGGGSSGAAGTAGGADAP